VDYVAKKAYACEYLEPGIVTTDSMHVTVTRFAIGAKLSIPEFNSEEIGVMVG
jgi:hypothetical protein